MGMALVAGSALSCWVSSSPSMPGIWMSMRIRSGRHWVSVTWASSASPALRPSYPSAPNSANASRMLIGLSSTIRMRSPGMRRLRRGDAGRGRRDMEESPQLLDDLAAAGSLLHHGLGPGLEPVAFLVVQVLDGPDDHRRL